MHLAFLSLYLISSDGNTFSSVNPGGGNPYVDIQGNYVDINSYCENRLCILKCCDYGLIMNNIGDCSKTNEYTGNMNNSLFNMYKGDIMSGLKKTEENLNKYLLFSQRAEFWSDRFTSEEFYILENGTLKLNQAYPKERWIEAPPLSFCADLAYRYTTDTKDRLRLSFIMTADYFLRPGATIYNRYVIAGMLISICIVTLIMCRISPQVLKTITPITVALIVTLVIGYILKIVQVFALSVGIPSLGECKRFSAAYYFFILSNFFWSNILIFDLWWRIRSSRKHGRDFYHRDVFRFILYCIFGWGVPLLMTLGAMAAKIWHLNERFSIEKPPFDSCFRNEMQTTLYLHVPVSILTLTYYVLISMFIYHTFVPRLAEDNSPPQSKLISTHHKVIITIKTVVGLAAVCTLLMSWTVLSVLLFIALVDFTVDFWLIFCGSLGSDKSIIAKMIKRLKTYYLRGKYRALVYLEQYAREGLKRSEVTEMINEKDNNSEQTVIVSENVENIDNNKV